MTSMIAQCPSCLTEFELDPNKVPLTGLRARCSVCSAVIAVPAASVAQRRSQPAHTAPTAETPASTPASTPVPAHSPTAAVADVEGVPVGAPAEVASETASEVAGTAALDASAPTSTTDPQRSAHVTESGESEAAASAAPAVQHPTAAHASDAPKEAPRRRPVNPFLTRDPALRAKRLARALVSDIVAYHPAKHAEGLRDGTLKTLFREEIRKSYEEYVEQVGREFAESTTHFKDALNDVLAGGRLQF